MMFSFSGGKCMVYRGRPEPNPWNSRRQVLVDAVTVQVHFDAANFTG